MEAEGGLPRAEAEQMAAAAQGFPDPDALHAAAAEGWRRNLEALARRERSKHGRERIAAALAFIRDGWAEKAAALGWSEVELFGADPRAPWNRLDRMGIAWATHPTVALTPETATLRAHDGNSQTRWRIRVNNDGGARLPREAMPP